MHGCEARLAIAAMLRHILRFRIISLFKKRCELVSEQAESCWEEYCDRVHSIQNVPSHPPTRCSARLVHRSQHQVSNKITSNSPRVPADNGPRCLRYLSGDVESGMTCLGTRRSLREHSMERVFRLTDIDSS